MAERRYYLGLQLLDRQLVAHDGALVGKVDDVELEETDDGQLFVSAILSGPGVLAERMGFRYGARVQRAHRLLGRADGEPARVAFRRIVSIGTTVELAEGQEELASESMDRWVNQHLIGHIPGNRHATE